MADRWIKNAAKAMLVKLGYEVRRKPTLRWGDDASRDQQLLLDPSTVSIVLDVGANVGDTVRQYRALFPAATVHAFEPSPDVYRQLAARFESDAQVRTYRLALSDTSGVRPLYVNAVDVTNSLLPLIPSSVEWARASSEGIGETIDVAAVTLDDFCSAEGLSRIDLLKMDIQGGEAIALRGATRLLGRRAVRLLYVEVLFAPLYDGQAYFSEVAEFLAGYGYRLFGLYNLMFSERGLGWADAIFRPADASTAANEL